MTVTKHVAAAPLLQQRLAFLLLLAPAYVLAVLFWRVPVPEALTVPAMLLDRLLQVATVLVLPTSLLVIVTGSAQWARRAVIAAAVVAIVLGGSATIAALHAPRDFWPSLLSVASLVGGIGSIALTRAYRLVSLRRAVSIGGVLALLPLVQFWHTTSYVPARLTPTVGADVNISGRTGTGEQAIGEVEVVVRNDGQVGAQILASELILCYWSDRPHYFLTQAEMYSNENCETEQIFENLSEVNPQSAWTVRRTFERRAHGSSTSRIVQAAVFVWYARMDRLRVGDREDPLPANRGENCRNDSELLSYVVQEDSRVQGIVNQDRRLLYLRLAGPGDAYFALTTVGEPGCELTDGLPRPSEFDLARRAGIGDLRLNHEAWLD